MNPHLIDSILLGGLAAWIGADAVGLLTTTVEDRSLGMIERERRERRRVSRWYAMFETWVSPLSRLNEKLFAPVIDALRQGDAEIQPFTPAEFIAICELKALAWGTVAALSARVALHSGLLSSCLWGALAIGIVMWILVSGMLRNCLNQQKQIRSRLPFTVELIALLMEAGGTDIMEAIRTAGKENEGHPLGRRLNRLVVSESRGIEFCEALREWSTMYRDEDLIEFAFAIRTSIERGTPLEETLRSLSDQFQQRRLQRLERAAEETKVHITWPGMLVLVACLLIVTAPFILAARDMLGW